MSDSTPAAAHLDAERLAALADEPPTPGEAAHLNVCTACRREREAYVALVALARAEGLDEGAAGVYVGAGAPAAEANVAGAWDALAAALRAEGLAGARGLAHGPAWVHRVQMWRPTRLAAGLLLVVGAAVAGRLSATRGPVAVTPSGTPNGAPDAAGAFASSEDARAALARARRDYARAATFLAAADPGAGDEAALAAADGSAADRGAPDHAAADLGTADGGTLDRGLANRAAPAGGDAELLRARLATIDALLPRVRAAARQAPEDPAVNQLYLSAYDARETALRQLGRTLPAGVQLTGY